MLESTPEHECENDNETGFTEPPDISFDWPSSTASDARQARPKRIYSILSQSDGDEASGRRESTLRRENVQQHSCIWKRKLKASGIRSKAMGIK